MAYTIEIKNLDKLREAFEKMPEVVGKELKHTVNEVGALLTETEKREAPIKSGTLRRDIAMRPFGFGVAVGPSMEYAFYVHEGTGLYGKRGDYIRPRKAKVLAFKGSNGQMVFTKRVAGQKPNPFVKRTVEQSEDKVNKIIDNTLENIFKTI